MEAWGSINPPESSGATQCPSHQDGPTHAWRTEHLLASCDSIWDGSCVDSAHTLWMVSLPCPPPKALQGHPRAWRKAENCCPLLTLLRGMCGCSERCVDLQSASTGALLSSGPAPGRHPAGLPAGVLTKKSMVGKKTLQNTWRMLSAHMGHPQSAPSPSSASTRSALWPMDFQARLNSGSCHRPGKAAVDLVCNCTPQLLCTARPVVPAGQQLAQRAGQHSTAHPNMRPPGWPHPHPDSKRWPCLSRGLDPVASGGPGQPQPSRDAEKVALQKQRDRTRGSDFKQLLSLHLPAQPDRVPGAQPSLCQGSAWPMGSAGSPGVCSTWLTFASKSLPPECSQPPGCCPEHQPWL